MRVHSSLQGKPGKQNPVSLPLKIHGGIYPCNVETLIGREIILSCKLIVNNRENTHMATVNEYRAQAERYMQSLAHMGKFHQCGNCGRAIEHETEETVTFTCGGKVNKVTQEVKVICPYY